MFIFIFSVKICLVTYLNARRHLQHFQLVIIHQDITYFLMHLVIKFMCPKCVFLEQHSVLIQTTYICRIDSLIDKRLALLKTVDCYFNVWCIHNINTPF